MHSAALVCVLILIPRSPESATSRIGTRAAKAEPVGDCGRVVRHPEMIFNSESGTEVTRRCHQDKAPTSDLIAADPRTSVQVE